MRNLRWNLAITVIAGLIIIACWFWLPRPNAIHRNWIPIVPLSQIRTGEHFIATVQNVRYGFSNAEPNPMPVYVVIVLKPRTGPEFGLYERDPASNVTAFADSLVVGRDYRFPEILSSNGR